MGVVFRVSHQELGRDFAAKVIGQAALLEKSALARFEREARAVARLRHPNIVDIVDFGALADGTPCFVMELLEGESLDEHVARGPMPWQILSNLGHQLFAGLAAAHAAGVIHRDIKPQNLMVSSHTGRDEELKIVDFGLASALDGTQITATDAGVLGSPCYLAPEQVEGRRDQLGPASDLFSAGVVLLEMASGKNFYNAGSIPASIARIVTEDAPDVREFRLDAPAPFAQLLRQLLTRNPKHRLGSAETANRLLAAALDGNLRDSEGAPGSRAPTFPNDAPTPPGSDPTAVQSPAALLASASERTLPRPERSAATFGGRKAWAIVGASVILASIVAASAAFLLRNRGEEATPDVEIQPAPPSSTGVAVEPDPSLEPARAHAPGVTSAAETTRIDTDEEKRPARRRPGRKAPAESGASRKYGEPVDPYGQD